MKFAQAISILLGLASQSFAISKPNLRNKDAPSTRATPNLRERNMIKNTRIINGSKYTVILSNFIIIPTRADSL